MPRAFDCAGNTALEERRHTGYPAGQDLAALGNKFPQEPFVAVVDFVDFEIGESPSPAAPAAPARSAATVAALSAISPVTAFAAVVPVMPVVAVVMPAAVSVCAHILSSSDSLPASAVATAPACSSGSVVVSDERNPLSADDSRTFCFSSSSM